MKKVPLLILFVFILVSCHDENEYLVDSAFEPYVLRFEQEAAKKGENYDFKTSGLIIKFTDLKNDQAGLCHYEKPVRIEIDSIYWKLISNNRGSDLMKENLIFHELGHGILKRSHTNATLANGDWKSIMCGGDKVDNRPWNINYRGIRREYYIDELFNEDTPEPSFASMTLPVDTSGYVNNFFRSFDSDKLDESGWKISDNKYYTTSIDNKQLKFQSKIDYSYFIALKTDVNMQDDFIYDLDIRCQSQLNDDQYGIFFGNPEISDNDIEYFVINNNKNMYMGDRLFYSFFTEIQRPEIIPYGENHLRIFKKGDMLYYFINGVYTYCSEWGLNESGYYYGFVVPTMATVWVDNMKISLTPQQQILQKIKLPEKSIKYMLIKKQLDNITVNK